jgi:hypothetical protein
MGKPRDLANVVATGNILADGAVAPAELTGVNATAAEINILDGVTATAAELNLLDGVTATTAELNYVDGVTSNVQTQMDTKAPVADPTFTGTATAPTVNASTALQIGGTAITATAAELNKMDGVTVSASDINSVTTKAPAADPTFTGTLAAPTINASTKLQVNGTDVITNARALSNITSIDATTAAAIGAGGVGGGGEIELTASGSITAGNPVGIKPSGSVSKLEPKYTRSAILSATSNRSYIDCIYVGSNKIVVLYRTSSAIIKAKVGTISGNSISFGSEVHVNSDTQGGSYCQVTYDSNSGNVIFVWTVGSDNDKGYIRAGTISGTTITLGSSSTNIANGLSVYSTDIEFDPDVQRGLVCYKWSNEFRYTLFSLGGTGNRTITLVEDRVAVSGSQRADDIKMAYDTSADKMVAVFRDASNGTINFIAGDVSSTSVTWGSVVGGDTNFTVNEYDLFDLTFVPTLNKVGFVYRYAGTDTLKAGTITLSGTTITKNESEILNHGNIDDYSNISMSADPSGNVLIVYGDADSSLPDKIRAIIGNYSGNTFVPTLSDFTLISSDGSPNHIYYGYYALCYTDSTNDKYVLMNYTSINDGDSNTNTYYTYTIPSTDNLFAYDNWIGLASQSVSNGASVDVTVQGGLNENQSNLTVGRKFYVQDDGTISTTFQEGRLIGISTAATKLFLTNGSITLGPTGFNFN